MPNLSDAPFPARHGFHNGRRPEEGQKMTERRDYELLACKHLSCIHLSRYNLNLERLLAFLAPASTR